uniref:exodeoxyribonuclease III n=1 Tax=Acanthochromis polyacanthus TaxID=80966 RepID=A0A3Q1GA52_9TELE
AQTEPLDGFLHILSWNVKGANETVKGRKLLLYLKHKKVDICFLQETHLCDEESNKLQRDWVGRVFFSANSSKQRGVAILIGKNLKVHKQYSDEEGRWLAIDVDLLGVRYSLINIYAPNTDSPGFFVI